MKFKELGISNSLLWFLISIFLFVWLGNQLFGAVTELEIQNLRVTNSVSFNLNPVWFSIIVSLKTLIWGLSSVVMYKYAKSKFTS